ncbi:glyoxalase-like protein [Nocardiopsis sp. Huas11]|uniref:VOC family protein n=1 Tax=Nocardiopsis sp. Huas11 TaxID=2183912 RepID=UPI000EAB8923|nr:VOC family protein [Nocardiopsis sp. Huas11]RKS07984.1 glyoxalase-like protein [Nocardiopsis sp. Huas11]
MTPHRIVVDGLHHVGHLVRDLGTVADLYRRMGFTVPTPVFPALAPAPGEPPRPVGAGNTRLRFANAFLELVGVVTGEGPGSGVDIAPLEVPDHARAGVFAAATGTARRLAERLETGEGLHVLVWATADADGEARRLDRLGIEHGGVQRLRRPGGGGGVPVGYLEVDPNAPEARLAAAEPTPGRSADTHSNGAVALAGVVMSVPPGGLARTEERYERYLDRTARTRGAARVFDLGRSELALVEEAPAAPPGSGPRRPSPRRPALTSVTVTVADQDALATRLADQGIPARTTEDGGLSVGPAWAHGAELRLRSV